jgi:ABC-type iron transport system FetAB ATPase subunit
MPGAELIARDLLVVRGGRRIVDAVSLRVEPGEMVVLEGPSGSGKSTFLRALATLIPSDGGDLLLGGRDARSIQPREYRCRVAYVPQLPPMFDGTVARNIGAGPALRGITLTPVAEAALLDQVGLPSDFLPRPARDLSGGERQRIAFARALANEPDVLLLDEPTSALDPAAAERIVEVVRTLAASGRTLVVVTHAAEQAAALGGRRCVFEAGRLRPRESA